MSERAPKNHEQAHQSHEKHHQNDEKGSEQTHRHEHREKIDQIRETAAEQAVAAEKVTAETEQATHTPRQAFANKELKDLAYARTLKRVRQNLSKPGAAFSKFIHQPVVDALSEGTAKTVGRSSGILGGGLIALVGTTAYYYITKHYGYDYNFFVFLALLVGGFVAGLVCEFILRTMRGSR